jgi:hypothetical protein
VKRCALFLVLAGCGGAALDAGSDVPRGLLPVDDRSPVVVVNDGPRDNWQGEFALLLASTARIALAGIVVNTSPTYPSLETNTEGWRDMVSAARTSGLRNIPDPIASVATSLVRPTDGNIDATQPNHSEGARFIVDVSHRLSRPLHPVAVATGGTLTDVADAYLIDPTVVDRVVVLASLGHPSTDGQGAVLNSPNGPLDPWADEIVARKFRYVQVNGYYAQKEDVTADRVGELPANPFGAWMIAKLPDILELHEAADQLSVIAVAFPDFSLDVKRMSVSGPSPDDPRFPSLASDANGRAWLVSRGDNAATTERFWKLLKDPATFVQ